MRPIEISSDRLQHRELFRNVKNAFLLFSVSIGSSFLVHCSGDPSVSEESGEETAPVDSDTIWKFPAEGELAQVAEATPTRVHQGGAYEQVCAACHGSEGEGNELLQSPSIAGLPAWYIEEQFRKFREGERGIHPEDIPGQQMRGIALSLSEEQIGDAAETVSKLPVILTEAPGPDADLEKGRYLFANECMECHRYNGRGEVVFRSAQLISLNRTYLRRQLENYHEKRRGAGETDIYGNKMVNVTAGLNEEEMDLLVDYIGALAHGDDPRPARDR